MAALLVKETLDEKEILEVTGLPPATALETRPLPQVAGAAEEATRVAAEAGEDSVTPPVWPVTEGTFTVTTDGEILANNTDEGAATGARGKTLAWMINVRTKQAPTALIKID